MIRVYFKTGVESVEVSGERAEFTKLTQIGEFSVLRITANYEIQAEFPAETVLGWKYLRTEPTVQEDKT